MASDYVAGGVPERLVARAADGEALVVAGRRRGPSVAFWGMAMLVASEVTLFGTFIGTYYYLRFESAHWPPPGTPEPRVGGAADHGRDPRHLEPPDVARGRGPSAAAGSRRRASSSSGRSPSSAATSPGRSTTTSTSCKHSTPQDNAYSSIYYVLLGADHAHVAVGVLLTAWLLWKLARGLTLYRIDATRVVAFYWHAVNVLTLIVLGVLLSATL